jgi:hypothetical protein
MEAFMRYLDIAMEMAEKLGMQISVFIKPPVSIFILRTRILRKICSRIKTAMASGS